MSTTLSNGYKLPADGDRGSTWFDDLESNITRVNGHTHDASDSEAIPAKNLTKGTSTILAANWSLVSGGTYKQTITLPSGYTMAATLFKFQINNGSEAGDLIFPTIEQASATSYEIYINDSTVEVLATYG